MQSSIHIVGTIPYEISGTKPYDIKTYLPVWGKYVFPEDPDTATSEDDFLGEDVISSTLQQFDIKQAVFQERKSYRVCEDEAIAEDWAPCGTNALNFRRFEGEPSTDLGGSGVGPTFSAMFSMSRYIKPFKYSAHEPTK